MQSKSYVPVNHPSIIVSKFLGAARERHSIDWSSKCGPKVAPLQLVRNYAIQKRNQRLYPSPIENKQDWKKKGPTNKNRQL